MAYTGTYKNKAATIVDNQALGYKVNRVFDPRIGSDFQRVVVQTVARSRIIGGKETERGLRIKTTWLVPTGDAVQSGTTFNEIPGHWHPNCNYRVGTPKKTEDGRLRVKVTPVFQPSIPLRHIEISEKDLATHAKKGLIDAEIVAKHAIRK
ncbi:MAG: hypothetical protein WCX64_03975 [Candidatus Micrarchaeia archaeon]